MSEITSKLDKQGSGFLSRPLWPAMSLDVEKAIYLLFIALAIITRLWGLGDRVMSHDESLHTQFSYQYYDGQGYNHTPLMHGPFLFHVTALAYWLFGANDFAARLPVALFGVVLVVIPYFLRERLGRIGALFTSFVFLISPYVTYYSRYIRHDIYVIMWAMIVMIAMWYYLDRRKEHHLWWFVIGTALMFSTKEVSFIYVAIFGSFLVLRLLLQLVPTDSFRRSLPILRLPLIIVAAGLLLLGGAFLGQRAAGVVTTAETTVEATEGFAADPNVEPPPAAEPDTASATDPILRWAQILGLGLAGLGLFVAARALRPQLDALPEFDLIMLFATLLLPLASPLFTKMAGWNPTDYTLSQCQLAGQESMSALQIMLGRASSSVCWLSLAQSGIVRSGFFLLLAYAVGILLGLWWNRRRWLIAAAIFNGILLVLFTSVFTNLGGWTTGTIGSLGYWLEQQAVQRGSQPSFYYLFVVPFYEFLPLIFSLLAIRLWAQQQRINAVAGYWLALLLAAFLGYSLANWLFAAGLAAGQEASPVPGLLVAGLILLAGATYWLALYRRRLMKAYGAERHLGELFDHRALLGFVPFLTYWLLLTWLAYSYAGEKMPWLSTHFVIPMGMLTGWYFNEKLRTITFRELFSRPALLLGGLTALLVGAGLLVVGPILLGRLQLGSQEVEVLATFGRFLGSLILVAIVFYFWLRLYRRLGPELRNRVIVLSIFALLSLLTIRFTYMANFPNADYTTEFMVYAHGAPATKHVVLEQVEELSLRLNGDKGIRVAFDSDVSWPLTWYLRDYPNRVFFGESPSQSLNDSPVIIVGAKNWDKVEPYLGNNYDYTEHTFLWWPMEEYRQISLNAILGDPRVPPEQRRGLGNAAVRQALWDIFFYRDYQKYSEVFGGTYTAGEWPLRHNLRLYIRNDVLPTLWDYGVGAVSVSPLADPYAEGELTVAPILVLNEAGVAGGGPGELTSPRNMAIGPDGRIFVADSGNHRIQVYDRTGEPITSWGTFGDAPGQFNEPWSLAVDDEYVYVADTWNHRIQKFTHDGELVDAFGESGSPPEGAADQALGFFFGPRSVLLLDDSRLLVTDTGNHRMQLLDRDGNFLQGIGGFGNALGRMNEPVGLSQSSDGFIYLADTWNGRVQQFTPDLFAINEWPVSAWEGTSINNKPYSAVDSAGRVYVTDPEGYRVLVFDAGGAYLARFGAFGSGLENLGLPNGIAIDGEDNIYVADSGNNRVLKYAPLFGPPVTESQEQGAGQQPDAAEVDGAEAGAQEGPTGEAPQSEEN